MPGDQSGDTLPSSSRRQAPPAGRRVGVRALAATAAAVTAAGLATAAVTPADAAPAAVTAWRTSFESGQPQPSWTSTPETLPNGRPDIAGVAGESPAVPGAVHLTAAGGSSDGHDAAKLVDGDVSTTWQVGARAASVTLTPAATVPVVRYVLTSAGDTPARDPKAWLLQGSDDGTHWHTVDKRTGQSFSQRNQQRIFELANPARYPHLRLRVTNNHGDADTQLAELSLAGKPATPAVMTTELGDGPASGATVAPKQGFTGTRALHYAGWGLGASGAHATDKLFAVTRRVQRNTRLSYEVFPEFTGHDLTYPSTDIAVDLTFTDGTRLRDLHPSDQYGMAADAKGQGAAKILHQGQWNHVVVDLGSVAAGKTIARVLLEWHRPAGSGSAQFGGWLDDLAIDHAPAGSCADAHLANCVTTTRGTNSSGDYSRGATIPAAALPHGFNFWTPVTDASSTSNIYKYAQDNVAGRPQLQALAVSHEPSPWVGEHQTFQVMPSTVATPASADRKARALPFTHDHETARADYYGVTFDNGLRAEMTPTDHAAVMRFRFPGNSSSLIFDNVNNNAGLTIDRANGVVSGYSDVSGFWGAPRMFVYATFDKPMQRSGQLSGGGGDKVGGYAGFDLGSSRQLTMRIATSFIGVEQAKRNLALEVGTRSFDAVHQQARRTWDAQLGVVTVKGATEDQLTSLYSSLYRVNLYPNELAENTGTAAKPDMRYASPYSGSAGQNTPTQTGAKIVAGQPYANEGFWDTYRSKYSLGALLYPKLTGKLIDGFVQQFKDGGWIGQWTAPGYLGFSGTTSDSAIADAYLRGVHNFDVGAAYDAAIKDATVPSGGLTGRPDVQHSTFLGYTPSSTGSATSASLEDWISDYGISQMSQELYDKSKAGDPRRAEYKANARYFGQRAENYVHLFDKSQGFFVPKQADGSWKYSGGEFDPLNWNAADYTEGNGWSYAFLVPEDGKGLANLYGGRAALAAKLDQFFGTRETAQYGGGLFGPYHEMFESRDDDFGQWAFNDQPTMHVPYMYDYVGQPAKTAALVRRAMARSFTGSDIGQGYPGDEDNGSTGAFYVMNALGFYPLQMGSPNFAIGSPLFDQVTLHLPGGDTVITAHGNSARNIYVQGLTVNGKKHDSTSIGNDVLAGGSRIDFRMGPRPSNWGTKAAAAPVSPTKGRLDPDPQHDLTGTGTPTMTGGGDPKALFDDTSTTEATLPASAADVTYRLDHPTKVEQYTVTSGTKEGADPAAWTLQGSSDGTHWTVLDSQTDQKFTWRQQTRAFTPAKSSARFEYYRVSVAAPATSTPVSIAELELLGH